ncbi:MAG TPA: DUF1343 domain-containing protein [Anaerolineaceae bacterium]|nr:DUF1343 domain-containing protein [Anaerolineaceae bacterium]
MQTQTGLERLIVQGNSALAKARIGFVSQSAATLPDFTHGLDALIAAGYKLTALFGPEHGFRGAAADGAEVENTIDGKTGLPMYSLYGKTREPSTEMLAEVDALVFDMQDVGVRFYTYLSTLYYVLKSAGTLGKPVWVLDRPNPLGGIEVAGPCVEPGFESFVGILPLPIQYGMTLGELAGWMNARLQPAAELHVVSMSGWKRGLTFERTGLPWVPTSPGIPHLSTVRVYPGTCLVEGTNLSEGRGTALPFEMIGAPWLDGEALAEALNAKVLPGVRFRAVRFTPSASKHAGQVCAGIQIHLTKADDYRPIETGLHLIAACKQQAPEQFQFLSSSWEGHPAHFDLLTGSDVLRRQMESEMDIEKVIQHWLISPAEFEQTRKQYLLYA